MGFMDQLGGLIGQYLSGNRPTTREEAYAHYDQIYDVVPNELLGTLIGPALSSLGEREVEERIFNSTTQMDSQQRGGFMAQLLNGFQHNGIDSAGLLHQLGVNQLLATNPVIASPTDVTKVAMHAHQHDPGIFNRAMAFYAKNPILVKVLGKMAIAAIAGHLANKNINNNSRAALP
jgi:hypothetical protein